MIDLIFHVFSAIAMALYVFLVKDTVVNKSVTEQNFRYVKHLSNGYLLLIECIQQKHLLVRKSRWVRNKTYYTYDVVIIKVKGDKMYATVKRTYPHMCPRMFTNTTYPHRLAINACLDEITQETHHE